MKSFSQRNPIPIALVGVALIYGTCVWIGRVVARNRSV